MRFSYSYASLRNILEISCEEYFQGIQKFEQILMDPASADIVFVSFTASIITLAGLAAQSCLILNNLRDSLVHAREDHQQLVDKAQLIGALISAVQAAAVLNGDDGSREMETVWGSCYDKIEEDLKALNHLLEKLRQVPEGQSELGANIRKRLRWVFFEQKTARFNERFSSHIMFLQLVQQAITRCDFDGRMLTPAS